MGIKNRRLSLRYCGIDPLQIAARTIDDSEFAHSRHSADADLGSCTFLLAEAQATARNRRREAHSYPMTGGSAFEEPARQLRRYGPRVAPRSSWLITHGRSSGRTSWRPAVMPKRRVLQDSSCWVPPTGLPSPPVAGRAGDLPFVAGGNVDLRLDRKNSPRISRRQCLQYVLRAVSHACPSPDGSRESTWSIRDWPADGPPPKARFSGGGSRCAPRPAAA